MSVPMTYKVKDGSSDKKYFTIVPNYILNHSSATAQALYMQLKRLAGEDGVAYPTRAFLAKQLGVSKPTLRKELSYLVEKGWITYEGEIKTGTKGGHQKVKSYKIVDLWLVNAEHYKGGKSNTDLSTRGEKREPSRGEKRDPLIRTKYKEDIIDIYSRIFEVWNSQRIIRHRTLTDKMKRKINGLLRDKYTEEEIICSIRNYGEIAHGGGYYFKYKWTLPDFLQRGFEKFLDLEIAKLNYSKGEFNGTHQSDNKPAEGKYDKFNVL